MKFIYKLVPHELMVRQICRDADRITIIATPRDETAACPAYQRPAHRIHSPYNRNLSDLPWQGLAVTIALLVRRFRCANPLCARKIFGEQPPKITVPHACRSSRLADIQRHIGLALRGAAGSRLARRCIIDLLPDHQSATVEVWLAAHPSVEVVAHNRGAGYGHAAARARPDAVQIADRWHLIENASAAFLMAVRRSMRQIRQALRAGTIDPDLLTCAERRQYDGFLRREAINNEIRRLTDTGISIKQIVHRTGHSRQLIRNIVRGGKADLVRTRMSSLEPFLVRLDAEWEAGCRKGAELWRRLRAAGFAGSQRVVAEWTTRRRRAACAPAELSRTPPPSTRVITRLMTGARDQLSGADAWMIAVIEQAFPDLVAGRDLMDRIHKIIRSKAGTALDLWISDAAAAFSLLLRPELSPTSRLSSPQSSSPGQTGKQKARLPSSK